MITSPSEPVEIGDDPVALYRLYGKGDVLFYVGVTGAPGQRMAKHAATQPWWTEVVHKTMVWYPTRRDACKAEATAIEAEKPKYNISKNTNHSAARRARDTAVIPLVRAARAAALKDLQAAYRAGDAINLGGADIYKISGLQRWD